MCRITPITDIQIGFIIGLVK